MTFEFGLALFSNEPLQKTVELVKQAENDGFECAWIPDEKFYRDPYSTLTACALGTNSIRLGTGVTDPYCRHPIFTAANIATVNEISKGRAILGIGAGGGGLKALGIPRSKPETRLREAIQIIRSLVRGETVDCTLQTLSLKNAKLGFLSGEVPIYVGSFGPRILQLAGEVADGAILGSGGSASPEYLQFAFDMIEKGAKKVGRDLKGFQRVAWLHSAISSERTAALQITKPHVAVSLWNAREVIEMLPFGLDKKITTEVIRVMEEQFTTGIDQSESRALRQLVVGIPDELAFGLSLAGTVSDVSNKLEKITHTKVQQIAILFAGTEEERVNSYRVFVRDILPTFI